MRLDNQNLQSQSTKMRDRLSLSLIRLRQEAVFLFSFFIIPFYKFDYEIVFRQLRKFKVGYENKPAYYFSIDANFETQIIFR